MKIRNDFVTNSSSSSFLLAFTDEDSIKSELVKQFGVDGFDMDEFPQIYHDVMSAERMTKEQAIELIRDELEWMTGYELYEKHCREDENFYKKINRIDWRETEEAKKEIDNRLNELISKVDSKLNNNVLVEVEYSDHVHSELEHDIMPELECTVLRFNHH